MTDDPAAGAEPEPDARSRILRAAETLFAHNGFDRTPVSKIATLAGVPHGLVFYYFRTKDGLLLALLNSYSLRMIDLLTEDRDDAADGLRTPVELVTHTMGTMRHHLRNRTNVRRIVFQELAAHPDVRRIAQMFHEEATEAMSARLQRGMAALGLPIDREAAAAAARPLLATMIMMEMLYGHDDPRTALDDLATAVGRSLEHAARR